MNDKIRDLEEQAKTLADKLTDPSITPEEYSALSTEYISLKRKISSLKVELFMDGV